MEYRIFGKTNEKVSALGFGCMRLPVVGGDMGKVDEDEARKIIRYAIDQGINYIDTAYVYNQGQGEQIVGRILKDGYREKVKIATKLPVWNVHNYEDMERLLDEQLENLGTDCIDFYLIHALNKSYWPKLYKLGILDFMTKAKEKGKVKHLGFSFHDDFEVFKGIVDAFDWSFCQIQYNYVDEDFQAGRKGLEYAYSKGLGISVMEPLRGGNLVKNLSLEAIKIMETSSKKHTPAEWGLRWVWNHPQVGVVLSGMSTMQQVVENIGYAGKSKERFMEEEKKIIAAVQAHYKSRVKVGCTGCGYCMPCPAGVQIPQCFDLYNRAYMMDDAQRACFWYGRIEDEKGKGKASDCIQCRKCEEHCPQNIAIADVLVEVKELFENKIRFGSLFS